MRQTTFGDRFAVELRRREITVAEFSRRIGVDRWTIADWIEGLNAPRLENLQKVIRALPWVDVEWLICGTRPDVVGVDAPQDRYLWSVGVSTAKDVDLGPGRVEEM